MTGGSTKAGTEVARSVEVSRRQVLIVVAGVVLVLAGLAAVLAPRSPQLSPEVLNVVGIFTLVSFVYFALTWVLLESNTVVSPPVERRSGLEYAGEDFEASVRRRAVTDDELVPAVESNVRKRLRGVAQRLLDTQARRDPDHSDGDSWTDDELVATFLDPERRAELHDAHRTPESSERVRESWLPSASDRLPGTGWVAKLTQFVSRGRACSFEEAVERTVDELVSLGGIDTESERSWLDEGIDTRPDEWRTGHRTTTQWRGLTGLGLVTLGVGALFQVPGLALVAAVLLGVVGYTQVTSVPPVALAVERRFDRRNPAPGDAVTVTVTATNEGESVLPDVRLIDDVPDRLSVGEGTPRHATALRPGESATFEYDVLAVYGDHEFDSLHVAVRDASGRRERRETVDTSAETLVCEPGVLREDVPLHPATSGITGRVRSETGGSGQEFRAVREYRRGDPLRRVDWNRLARTGELASLQFVEEQAATVVLLVDARQSACRASAPGSLSALDRSLAGVSQLFTNLAEDGDRVGLASIGSEWLWIGPGAGPEHRSNVRSALYDNPAFDPFERSGSFDPVTYIDQLRRRLPNDAQLLVFSPLLDDAGVEVVNRLRAHGYETTVFSPDPTEPTTVGATVARLERDLRVARLRGEAAPLVDWPAGESLEAAVARAGRVQQ